MANNTQSNLGKYQGTLNGPNGDKYFTIQNNSFINPQEIIGIENNDPSNSNIINLSGVYIKTDVVNTSIKIDDGTNQFGHFMIHEIISIDLIDKSLIVYCEDSLPFRLLFSTSGEALIGYNRFYQIMNGANLT